MLSCDLVFKCLLSVSQTLSVHVKDLYEDCVNLFFNLILVEIHCWQIFVVFASSKLDSVFCLLLTLHFSVLLQYFTFSTKKANYLCRDCSLAHKMIFYLFKINRTFRVFKHNILLSFEGFDVLYIEWCLLCFAGFDVWYIEWCLLCFAGFDVWYIEWCFLCFAGFSVWHIEWCLLCFAGFDVWYIEWCLLCFAGFDVWHIKWCSDAAREEELQVHHTGNQQGLVNNTHCNFFFKRPYFKSWLISVKYYIAKHSV